MADTLRAVATKAAAQTETLVSGSIRDIPQQETIKSLPGIYTGPLTGRRNVVIGLTPDYLYIANEDPKSGDLFYAAFDRSKVHVGQGYGSRTICVQYTEDVTRNFDVEVATARDVESFIKASKPDTWLVTRDRLAEQGAAYRKTLS